MPPDLSWRAAEAYEVMDDYRADERMLARTYRRFAVVNAVISRPGQLYRRDIRPRARHGRLRILDVGAGGGDLCRSLAVRLRRDRLAADITALDADDRAVRWAAAHDDGAGVRYWCATTTDLVVAGETFDVVLSNHLLHHLTAAEFHRLLDDSRRLISSTRRDSWRTVTSSAVASPTDCSAP